MREDEWLKDEWDVQKVINTYAQNTGRGDWAPVVALFLADASWEIPHLDLKFEGIEAIRGALAMLSGDLEYVLQLNSPALIEIAGDVAHARSGIREAGKRKGRDEGFEFLGTYADTLVRTAQGWKFKRRVFEGIGTQYWPLVAAES
jgi:ketosteroid isomerase-like protein